MATLNKDIELVPRSKCEVSFTYTVEHQAPSGNWVRSYATNDIESARSMAEYEQNHGRVVRVVEEGV